MKATFNIVGRISRPPKLESSKDGTKTFARISLEVEIKDKKTYFTLTVWDKIAENFAKNNKDKEMVEVSGTMYVKPIEKKDGFKEYVPVLNVDKIKKVSKKDSSTEKSEDHQDNPEAESSSETASSDDISNDFDSMLPEDKSDNE